MITELEHIIYNQLIPSLKYVENEKAKRLITKSIEELEEILEFNMDDGK
jgi:hypothetical protein